ncbi:MAG: M67 family metallopeptidase [Dehalococcoidia bacterium]|nr:M67 family metallopeptidase [Dehalococcoidia bacterium]
MPKISQNIINKIVEHAQNELPNEACGLISQSKNKNVMQADEVTNTAKSPYRYEMSPIEMLKLEQRREKNNEDLFAIYHSHVASPAYPSPTDVRMAFFPPGETNNPPMFPDTYYILVSLAENVPEVRAFFIRTGGEIEEEIIEITM